MKKPHKTLQNLGTLSCTLSLITLYASVLTSDWLTLQEPQIDQNELDKLGPYDDDPKPYLLKAKFGLFKVCVQEKSQLNCFDFKIKDLFLQLFYREEALQLPTELINNCVRNMRFTLPFIGLSVLFTSAAFLSLTFGHFCQKNKKIIEASMLILGGLCQATALLTFVSQIGSEFESNEDFSVSNVTQFYRYKYGYSFYLFLLSFSLSELAALFDMAGYFRKYPSSSSPSDSKYVITFQPNQADHHQDYYMPPNSNPQIPDYNKHPDICTSNPPEFMDNILPPPQSYINTDVTITTIDNCCNHPYATIRNQPKFINNSHNLESFATMGRHPNHQIQNTQHCNTQVDNVL